MDGRTDLVIDSDDTDVTMIALLQYALSTTPYGDGTGLYVYRQTANETVDITATAQIVTEPGLGLSVADCICIFAAAGTDFTSGVTGFSHAKILKHYVENKTAGNAIGALATISGSGELTFDTTAFQRLFVSLYYERDKGGAAAINFREAFTEAEGLSLEALYHKHRAAAAAATAAAAAAAVESPISAESAVYNAVRQVTIEQQGAEARTLCRWSAMIRHKARCDWLVGQYWSSVLRSSASSDTFELDYKDSTELNTDGVAGWALVSDGAKCAHGQTDACSCQLQMEFDVKVWEADVPGCKCGKNGGKRDPCRGRCSCKGGKGVAAHRCGPMCHCLGGTRCGNNKKLDVPPPAAASLATATNRVAAHGRATTEVLSFGAGSVGAASGAPPTDDGDSEAAGTSEDEQDADGWDSDHHEDDLPGVSDEEEPAARITQHEGEVSDDDEEEARSFLGESQSGSEDDEDGAEDVLPFLGVA